jgi:hypothetical protein
MPCSLDLENLLDFPKALEIFNWKMIDFEDGKIDLRVLRHRFRKKNIKQQKISC